MKSVNVKAHRSVVLSGGMLHVARYMLLVSLLGKLVDCETATSILHRFCLFGSVVVVTAFVPIVPIMVTGVSSSAGTSSNYKRRNWMNKLRSGSNKLFAISAEEENDLVNTLFEPKTKAAYDTYLHNYRRSISDKTYEKYWSDRAYEYLDWDKKFHSVLHGSLTEGDVTWFAGGKLNVCYNAVDRHVYNGLGDHTAMIWEGDEPGHIRRISYNQLLSKVSQIANALMIAGVRQGDVVTIYMPMIPELAMTMLACARIGAIHSVVFAGFSSEALSQRIIAAQSKFVVTADVGKRGSKVIPLKQIVDTARALHDTDSYIEKVFVWEHGLYGEAPAVTEENGNNYELLYEPKPKDVRMDDLVHRQRPYCKPVSMDSEDNLFILYTSGSTGTFFNTNNTFIPNEPKGLRRCYTLHCRSSYQVVDEVDIL